MAPTKTLVIVESGAKAKTIAKYLNADKALAQAYGKFCVVPSYGHITDLDPKTLSVDLETFQPTYVVPNDKAKTVSCIKKNIGESDLVMLASDADREGAFIAFQLKEIFGLGKPGKKPFKRMTFTEITPKALKDAVLSAAGNIDEGLVQAQQARRVMDRIVGYKITPLLWKTFKTNGSVLSAGRVQSAVLNVVCRKEREIDAFQTSAYWNFDGEFVVGKSVMEGKLLNDKDDLVHKVDNARSAEALLAPCCQAPFRSVLSEKKSVKEPPPPPFTTSSLQQEAYSKLGMGIGMTMKVAQALYEDGLITYMRTDSHAIAQDCKSKIVKVIEGKFGAAYVGSGDVRGARKLKNSQEAHECIRPTNMEVQQILESKFDKKHRDLYGIIWKRTVASLMAPRMCEEQRLAISSAALASRGLKWVCKMKRVVFEGWGAVYGQKPDPANDKLEKELSGGGTTCRMGCAHNVWTSPPQRFTDASMVKFMEKEGIGRPSTYAATLSKLEERMFVEKRAVAGTSKEALDFVWQKGSGGGAVTKRKREVLVGNEHVSLVPTDIGKQIDGFMTQHFDEIADKAFTSNMEDELDRIANGEESYKGALGAFWRQLSPRLQDYVASKDASGKGKVDLGASGTRNIAGAKGKTYVARRTRYGPVIEHEEGGQKKYIDLRSYMKLFKKELDGIDNTDAGFLASLPRSVGDVTLCYGRYGFYIKDGVGKAYTIYPSHIKAAIQKQDPRGLLDLDCDAVMASASKSAATKRSGSVRKVKAKSS